VEALFCTSGSTMDLLGNFKYLTSVRVCTYLENCEYLTSVMMDLLGKFQVPYECQTLDLLLKRKCLKNI